MGYFPNSPSSAHDLYCLSHDSSQSMWKSKRIVIAASEILDGRSGYCTTRIVSDGSMIDAIDPKAGPVDSDLRGLTVFAGLDRRAAPHHLEFRSEPQFSDRCSCRKSPKIGPDLVRFLD